MTKRDRRAKGQQNSRKGARHSLRTEMRRSQLRIPLSEGFLVIAGGLSVEPMSKEIHKDAPQANALSDRGHSFVDGLLLT